MANAKLVTQNSKLNLPAVALTACLDSHGRPNREVFAARNRLHWNWRSTIVLVRRSVGFWLMNDQIGPAAQASGVLLAGEATLVAHAVEYVSASATAGSVRSAARETTVVMPHAPDC